VIFWGDSKITISIANKLMLYYEYGYYKESYRKDKQFLLLL